MRAALLQGAKERSPRPGRRLGPARNIAPASPRMRACRHRCIGTPRVRLPLRTPHTARPCGHTSKRAGSV